MILQITSCENAYICSWESNKAAEKEAPPPFIFLKREVKFNEIIDILEFEVTPIEDSIEENPIPSVDEINVAWLLSERNIGKDEDEIQRNALDFSRRNRNSVAYNHCRRVLLHYQSYRDMGESLASLRSVSRRFSKESEVCAREKGQQIADEVEASWTKATDARKLFGMSGSKARIADYYMDSILSQIEMPVCLSCGSLD